MAEEESKKDIALRRRIAQVMADILADKYDCTIKLKFRDEEPDDRGGEDESAAG